MSTAHVTRMQVCVVWEIDHEAFVAEVCLSDTRVGRRRR